MRVVRILGAAVLAICLAGCDFVAGLKRGIQHADETANDIQAFAGSRPAIGFKIENGRLASVTVTFPKPLETADLAGLTRRIRRAVESRFEQKPRTLVVGFQAADG